MGMPDRRAAVLDAAVRVLAEGGTRALTHRAVDAAAGVPAGTCSNHFRTRAALVMGIADELERRDRAFLAGLEPAGLTREALPDLAAAYVAAQVAEPTAQRARLALAVEPGVDLSPQHDRLRGLLADLCERAGIADPPGRARAVVDHLDGVLLHGLTIRTRKVEAGEVADAVRRLLG